MSAWGMAKLFAGTWVMGAACGIVFAASVLAFRPEPFGWHERPVPPAADMPMVADCRFDEGGCPGDVSLTIIGGWPVDQVDRCFLAADMASLPLDLCFPLMN